MVEKILNNTTPYGKIRASHEGSLHSSTLRENLISVYAFSSKHYIFIILFYYFVNICPIVL